MRRGFTIIEALVAVAAIFGVASMKSGPSTTPTTTPPKPPTTTVTTPPAANRTLVVDLGTNLGDDAIVTLADGTASSIGALDWVIFEAQGTSAPQVTRKKVKGVAAGFIVPTFDDSVHVDGGSAVHGLAKTVAPEEVVYQTGNLSGNPVNAEACQGHYEGAADDFKITAPCDPMGGKRTLTLFEGAWNGVLTVTAKVGAGDVQTFTLDAATPQNRAYKFTYSSNQPGEMLEVHTSVPANVPAHFLYGAALK